MQLRLSGGRYFIYILMICISLPACDNPRGNKKNSTRQSGTDSISSTLQVFTHSGFEMPDSLYIDKKAIDGLRVKIDSICKRYLDQGSVSGIAVHFQDLRSSEGFSLFPDKRFIPASLLKIPILIAVYKLEEEQPGSLNKELPVYELLEDSIDINLEENEKYPFRSDYFYTLKELAEIMISHSDNRATYSVLEYLNKVSPGILERVEADLKASIPREADNRTEIIYIGHFASMLDALFRCTYLNELHSNAVLEILTKSRYKNGFRKNIPPQISMAHKFGVRFNVTELNPEIPVQLHEVAIIYHPTNPFILSVMTKGTQVAGLRAALQEIASACHQEVELLSSNK